MRVGARGKGGCQPSVRSTPDRGVRTPIGTEVVMSLRMDCACILILRPLESFPEEGLQEGVHNHQRRRLGALVGTEQQTNCNGRCIVVINFVPSLGPPRSSTGGSNQSRSTPAARSPA